MDVIKGLNLIESTLSWILLLLLLQVSTLIEGQYVKVNPPGVFMKTLKSSGIIFTCKLEDYSSRIRPEIRWIDPSGDPVLTKKGRVHVEREGKTTLKLYIQAIQRKDLGDYLCEADVNGETLSGKTSMELYEEIKFFESPKKQTFRAGADAGVLCQATGRPRPEVAWRFKRKKLPQASLKYRYVDNGLVIKNVTRADSGTYECRGEVVSRGIVQVQRIHVDILYPPQIIKAPKDLSVIRGQPAMLECVTDANPPATYEWSKDQPYSDFISIRTPLEEGNGNTTFQIPSAREKDEGRYFCKASNALGSQVVHADITLLVPPKISPIGSKTHLRGSIAILRCKANARPIADIVWLKSGQAEPFREGEQDDSRLEVDNKVPGVSKLVIRDLQEADNGRYICKASNQAGKDQTNVTVTVESKPSIKRHHSTSQFAWRGQTRNFTCESGGLPPPTIKWLKQGQRLARNQTYTIKSQGGVSVLTIKVPQRGSMNWIYGKYQCIAENKHDFITQSYSLHRADVPDMPRGVEVVKETQTYVILKAEAPKNVGGLQISSWMVAFALNGNTTAQSIFFGSGDKMEVTGLEGGKTYRFRVSAGNSVGFGKSVSFMVKTPSDTGIMPQDMPRPKDVGPEGSNATYVLGKQGRPNNDTAKIAMVKQNGGGVGVAVGATMGVVILLLIVLIVLLLIRRKRKRDTANGRRRKGEPKVTAVHIEGKTIEPGVHIEMSRRTNGALADVMHKKSNGHVDSIISDDGTVTPINCVANNNPNSIQSKAWSQMLKKQAVDTSDEDEGEDGTMSRRRRRKVVKESSPIMDLPPPPAYLLEERMDASNYQDIFDGYHSEDAIDEDEHIELKMPKS